MMIHKRSAPRPRCPDLGVSVPIFAATLSRSQLVVGQIVGQAIQVQRDFGAAGTAVSGHDLLAAHIGVGLDGHGRKHSCHHAGESRGKALREAA